MTRSPRRVVLVAALAGGIILGAAGAPAALAQDTQPPEPPTNLRVVKRSWERITFAVDPAKDDAGIQQYVMFIDGQQHWHGDKDPSQLLVEGLEPNKSHTFTVRAIDNNYNMSADSKPLVASTTPWNPPADLRASVKADGAVELTWASGNGTDRTQYEVLEGSRLETIVPMDTATSVTIPRLAPGTHTLEVRARSMVFSGVEPTAGSRVTFTVPDRTRTDRTPPSVPANVRTFIDHRCEAFMTWSPSTDDVDPSSAIRYDVLSWDYRNEQRYVRQYGFAGNTVGSFGGRDAVRAVDTAGNVSAMATPN